MQNHLYNIHTENYASNSCISFDSSKKYSVDKIDELRGKWNE